MNKTQKNKDLEKFEMIEKKQRVVSVSLANKHEAKLTVAKSQEFRNISDERNIYILPKLTRDDEL